jgi:hypothetical protein
MEALNKEQFDRPESRLIASGANIDPISPDATSAKRKRLGLKAELLRKLASNGGIEHPKQLTLPIGTSLIRFSCGPFVDSLAGGEWWLDMEANRLVEAYATRHDLSIQDALSRLCAVPAEWNVMTLKVQFMTLAPLMAYKGAGKDAIYETDDGRVQRAKVDTLDGRKVMQLYVPGLAHPDLRRRALIARGSQHMPRFRRHGER